jgi:hypothetical protein
VAATVLVTAVLVGVFRFVERPVPLPRRPGAVAAVGAGAASSGLLAVSCWACSIAIGG